MVGSSTILGMSELWSWCTGGAPLRSRDPLTLTLSRRERGWGGPLAHATARGGGAGWLLPALNLAALRSPRGLLAARRSRGRQGRACGGWVAAALRASQ